MGEVFCVATWNEKKEKELLQWVTAKPGRYIVAVSEEETAAFQMPHPRIYVATQSDFSLMQVVSELLYLPYVYEDPTHPLLQKLARIQRERHFRASDFIDQGVKLLTNYRANLQHCAVPADDCFGKFGQYPAVVCGAGPSLKEVIPILREYRDQFLILGCGGGVEALLSAGVKPHISLQVDPNPSHRFSKTDIPLFFQLRTCHEVVSQARGPRFLMAGSEDFPLEQWIEEKMGLTSSSEGGWTATTRGAVLALSLGCHSIYFAGVDFALSSKNREDSVEIVLKDGSKLWTKPDWLLATEWLNEWVLKYPNQKWGIASKAHPLIPSIPSVNLRSYDELCAGPGDASSFAAELFSSCQSKHGKDIWEEITASFGRCQVFISEFLARFETIFPKSPQEDKKCALILQELEQQLVVQKILNPIWIYWETVLKREQENHPDALVLHRILLLKSLVYALA